MSRIAALVLAVVVALVFWLGDGGAPAPTPEPSPGSSSELQQPDEVGVRSADPGDEPDAGQREALTSDPSVTSPSVTAETSDPVVLHGTVFELRGSRRVPRPGATVSLGTQARYDSRELTAMETVTAGSDGRFEIVSNDPITYAELLIEAGAEGLTAYEWLNVWPKPGEELDGLELFLVPAVTMRGAVIDDTGAPVEGAAVSLSRDGAWRGRRSGPHPSSAYRPKPRGRTESGPGGQFVFEDIAADKDWTVRAREKKRKGEANVKAFGVASQPVEITLQTEAEKDEIRIFGTVLSPVGVGVPNARVTIVTDGQRETETRDDGSFELMINGRAYGGLHLIVIASGYAVATESLGNSDDDIGPLFVRLQPEQVISGVLVDADGKPIAGAFVDIDGEPEFLTNSVPAPTTLSVAGSKRVYTEADGGFRFGGLVDGTYRVKWSGPDAYAVAVVPAGTEDLLLQVGEVRGPHIHWRARVLDDLTGATIADASVDVMRTLTMQYGSGAVGVGAGKTDEEGVADLYVGALEGRTAYQFTATAAGYARIAVDSADYEPGTHELTIRMLPERSLRVEVVGADGEPAAGASVAVKDGEQNISIRTGRGGYQSPVSTDASGIAVLHGLPAKRVVVRAWSDYKKVAEQPVDLTAEIEGNTLRVFLPQ